MVSPPCTHRVRSEENTARRVYELTRSRRAVVEAYERECRRIEGDLHDGVQQYFVADSMAIGEAQLVVGGDPSLDRAQRLLPHVPVRFPYPLPTMWPGVLAAAYFFVSEALTNAACHSPGAPVTVLLTSDDTLRVSVVDAGEGGAVARPGGGLAEVADRLAGFDAMVTIHSPAGGPTRVTASILILIERGANRASGRECPHDGPG